MADLRHQSQLHIGLTKLWSAEYRARLDMFGSSRKRDLGARKFRNYTDGKVVPTADTLQEIEAQFPGTIRYFRSPAFELLEGGTPTLSALRTKAADASIPEPLSFEALERLLLAAGIASYESRALDLATAIVAVRSFVRRIPRSPTLDIARAELSIGVQTGPPIGAQKGPPFTMAQG